MYHDSVNSGRGRITFLFQDTATSLQVKMVNKIFVSNFGCSSNIADGERLAGCLVNAGFKIVTSEVKADLIIYNTCAVKGPTENRIISQIRNSPKDKKIVVAGCLPKISFERLLREVSFDGVVGPAVGGEIIEVVNRVLAGEKIIDLSASKDKPSLNLPRERVNPVVSILPINYGCLGKCTYCCVVHARGTLRSYTVREVLERAQADLESGAREFWVTSQDTASYGRDIRTNLAELLISLVGLEGDFYVRVGMMTPNLVIDIQRRLIEGFASAKAFKFLHLPIQSGDDAVLKAMRRRYTAKKFKEIVGAFRSEFPKITLATDVIVGFPGESEDAFQNTLDILKEVEPDVTNVSKFFARPKTAAWDMKDGLVDKEEIKRRSTVVSALVKKISAKRNKQWVGWEGKVLVDETGKVAGSWIGRNFTYKPIVVKSKSNLLGKTLQIKVIEASGTYLEGEIVRK